MNPFDRRLRVIVHNAQQVYLIGEFNNWSTTADPMSNPAPGVWEAPTLPAGRYGLFVVDDRWIPGSSADVPARTRVISGPAVSPLAA